MNNIIYLKKKLYINKDQFLKQMHLINHSTLINNCQLLIDQAQHLAPPEAAVEQIEANETLFCGQFFDTIEEDGQQIFVFLATCGQEISEWARQQTTLLERFWADKIAEVALYSVFDAAEKYLKEHHHLPFLRHVCPGATPAWPLQEQKKIFSLMAPAVTKMRIALTDDFYMTPNQSLSGIFFTSKKDLQIDCGYCRQENCDKKYCPYKIMFL